MYRTIQQKFERCRTLGFSMQTMVPVLVSRIATLLAGASAEKHLVRHQWVAQTALVLGAVDLGFATHLARQALTICQDKDRCLQMGHAISLRVMPRRKVGPC